MYVITGDGEYSDWVLAKYPRIKWIKVEDMGGIVEVGVLVFRGIREARGVVKGLQENVRIRNQMGVNFKIHKVRGISGVIIMHEVY
jgi:hypothetical protein